MNVYFMKTLNVVNHCCLSKKSNEFEKGQATIGSSVACCCLLLIVYTTAKVAED